MQHLALSTKDLQTSVEDIHGRGIETIYVPHEYYPEAKERLAGIDLDWMSSSGSASLSTRMMTVPAPNVHEDVAGQPTVFFEFIERRGATGFGLGNFKALFQSIEREQAKRGNL